MLAMAVAAAPAACGSPTGPSGPNGTLTLRITDAPFDEARAVLVTFSDVSAHMADAAEESWIELPFADAGTTRTCDLKKLQDSKQDILGAGTLQAGRYTQVRLVISSAQLFFDNEATGPACASSIPAPEGRSAALTVSSGEVKLVRPFTVPEGGATTMLVDFDGGRSVIQTGNGQFRMAPVVGVVSVE
jgi:hypothetical protein